MTLNAMPEDRQLALAPLDEKVDHVRGSPAGPLIIEYGDYECPYSRQAFHAIEQVEQQLGGNVRFAFRHFPLTGIHPHALAAAAAAEAAALQGWFWDMHELLFHRQKALENGDLRGYAAQLGLDVAAFDRDRASTAVADRIRRDVDSGVASGQVLGTPTLFIDGVVHRGGYDPPALLAVASLWRRGRPSGWLEGGGEQVAGGQAAVGPPFLRDGQHLLLRREVIELVGGPDGLAQREVARQHDVLPAQRDEHGALHGPRAYSGNRGELGHEFVVGQVAQGVLAQPAVRQPRGEVAEGADLPPRQAGLAEFAGIGFQQLSGRRETAAEQGLDAGQGSAGRGNRQLLPGDLEQQGAEQVHRRQLCHPCPGVEVRPVVDKPRQHGVGGAQVRARLPQPLDTAGGRVVRLGTGYGGGTFS